MIKCSRQRTLSRPRSMLKVSVAIGDKGLSHHRQGKLCSPSFWDGRNPGRNGGQKRWKAELLMRWRIEFQRLTMWASSSAKKRWSMPRTLKKSATITNRVSRAVKIQKATRNWSLWGKRSSVYRTETLKNAIKTRNPSFIKSSQLKMWISSWLLKASSRQQTWKEPRQWWNSPRVRDPTTTSYSGRQQPTKRTKEDTSSTYSSLSETTKTIQSFPWRTQLTGYRSKSAWASGKNNLCIRRQDRRPSYWMISHRTGYWRCQASSTKSYSSHWVTCTTRHLG